MLFVENASVYDCIAIRRKNDLESWMMLNLSCNNFKNTMKIRVLGAQLSRLRKLFSNGITVWVQRHCALFAVLRTEQCGVAGR
jgi:hypothetical protein